MKKNFGRKMAAVTAGVMLMGCFSVNAFAGEAVKAVKVQAASIDAENGVLDVPMKDVTIADKTSVSIKDDVALTLMQDFEIISEADGVKEIRDKKTGESFFLSFTAAKDGNMADPNGTVYSVGVEK